MDWLVLRPRAPDAHHPLFLATCSAMVIEQIKAQLDRLVPIHKVSDLGSEGPYIERELALIKVVATGE
ncbi:MAG: hypothetical protein OXB97_06515, partial [Rhodospirillales bacterium]|nr:hypothetical protein [Rhodospirillales bacterium]